MAQSIMRQAKPILLVTLCLALIAGSGWSIWRTQFADPRINLALHRAVARAMAEETVKLLNGSGKVVVIAIELAGEPELKVQLDEFERALKPHPKIELHKTYKLETDDKPKYSFGSGLSGRRLVRIVNKTPGTDLYVSFLGAPALSESELAELKSTPRLLAEARAADKLRKPFEQKLLQTAIVSRFKFPNPVAGTPSTPKEWFDQRWQIVSAANVKELPSGKAE
jgi:hypothetical protein